MAHGVKTSRGHLIDVFRLRDGKISRLQSAAPPRWRATWQVDRHRWSRDTGEEYNLGAEELAKSDAWVVIVSSGFQRTIAGACLAQRSYIKNIRIGSDVPPRTPKRRAALQA
jgi:hypothetical protein